MTLEEVYGQLLTALRSTATPYAFMGALGAIAWGRPRATTDLDLVVVCDAEQFRTLEAALLSAGLERGKGVGPADAADPLDDIAVFWAGPKPAVRVDLFIAKLDFEREVVSSALEAQLFGAPVKVARPEAMLVYKLLASRPKDLIDVESILESRAQAGHAIDWDLTRRWAEVWGIAEGVDALRSRK